MNTDLQVFDGYDPPVIGYFRTTPRGQLVENCVADIVAQPNDADTDAYARLFASAPVMLSACKSAALVIRKMDSELTARGVGLNLSAVPGFEGRNFADSLDAIAAKVEGRDHSTADLLAACKALLSQCPAAPGTPLREAADALRAVIARTEGGAA